MWKLFSRKDQTSPAWARYLGHGAAQDVLVLVLGDVLLVVVRLQHQLHLLHHALLPVQLLQELPTNKLIRDTHVSSIRQYSTHNTTQLNTCTGNIKGPSLFIDLQFQQL